MSIKTTQYITRERALEIIASVYAWYIIRPHYNNPLADYDMKNIFEYSNGEVQDILNQCTYSRESDVDGYPISIFENYSIVAN